MSARARARVTEVAVAAAFAAAAAALFALGDERGGPLTLFLAWLAVHVLYGIVANSFWALLIVVSCPPLFVASTSGNADDTPLWLQSFFVELFYGVPFAFMGVVGRRLWQARRPPDALPVSAHREEPSE